MNRKEATDRKLAACNDVANWALREGFDTDFVRWAWEDWIEELVATRRGDDVGVAVPPPSKNGPGRGAVLRGQTIKQRKRQR